MAPPGERWAPMGARGEVGPLAPPRAPRTISKPLGRGGGGALGGSGEPGTVAICEPGTVPTLEPGALVTLEVVARLSRPPVMLSTMLSRPPDARLS